MTASSSSIPPASGAPSSSASAARSASRVELARSADGPPERAPTRRRRRVVLTAAEITAAGRSIGDATEWSTIRAILHRTGWPPQLAEAAVRWSGWYWLTADRAEASLTDPQSLAVACDTVRLWHQQPTLRTLEPWDRVAQLWDVSFLGRAAMGQRPRASVAPQLDPRLWLRLRLPDVDGQWLADAWSWTQTQRPGMSIGGWDRHLLTHPAADDRLWALARDGVSAHYLRSLAVAEAPVRRGTGTRRGAHLTAEARTRIRLSTQAGQPLRPFAPVSRSRLLASPTMRSLLLDLRVEGRTSQGEQLRADVGALHLVPGLAGEELARTVATLGPRLTRWSGADGAGPNFSGGTPSSLMLELAGLSRPPGVLDLLLALRPAQLRQHGALLTPVWRDWLLSPSRDLREAAVRAFGRQREAAPRPAVEAPATGAVGTRGNRGG